MPARAPWFPLTLDAVPPPQLTNTIMDIVQQATNYKQLKKGANEGGPVELQAASGSLHAALLHAQPAGPGGHA